ncbi:hypothetical protein V6N12_011829 [Hibiscus sabdariffa]|uniref:Uncharacterized protein n=1 Tax=Hibiscus sabdariffa TaxID=183260 RepID=A0ABR2CGS5_9ROSI
MKQHLVGGFTSVHKCPQCPEHVREEVNAFMLKKEETKITNLMSSQNFSYDVDDHDEEEKLEVLNSGGNKDNSSQRSGIPLPKKPRAKGPMDLFVAPEANPHKEGSVQAASDKQLRDATCGKIARFFYDAGIAFNAASYPSFTEMCEGKDVTTSSVSFTLRSAHQALSHHDDEVEEDIGEDGDYRLDGDDFCLDGGDLE